MDETGSRPAAGNRSELAKHSRVLFRRRRSPGVRLHEITDLVNVPAQAVKRTVTELEATGVTARRREEWSESHSSIARLGPRHLPGKVRSVGDSPGGWSAAATSAAYRSAWRPRADARREP